MKCYLQRLRKTLTLRHPNRAEAKARARVNGHWFISLYLRIDRSFNHQVALCAFENEPGIDSFDHSRILLKCKISDVKSQVAGVVRVSRNTSSLIHFSVAYNKYAATL
jgi:hypothetical protein